MSDTSTDQGSTPAGRTASGGTLATNGDGGGASPPDVSADGNPRLIEEHHIRGRYGEDELEATDDRGRRWYHLRPDPRGRYDMIGFNYTWWLIWIVFILIVFLPWGRGWGY
jgi:hypothetical protein